jgi:hypothetical protein
VSSAAGWVDELVLRRSWLEGARIAKAMKTIQLFAAEKTHFSKTARSGAPLSSRCRYSCAADVGHPSRRTAPLKPKSGLSGPPLPKAHLNTRAELFSGLLGILCSLGMTNDNAKRLTYKRLMLQEIPAFTTTPTL